MTRGCIFYTVNMNFLKFFSEHNFLIYLQIIFVVSYFITNFEAHIIRESLNLGLLAECRHN